MEPPKNSTTFAFGAGISPTMVVIVRDMSEKCPMNSSLVLVSLLETNEYPLFFGTFDKDDFPVFPFGWVPCDPAKVVMEPVEPGRVRVLDG